MSISRRLFLRNSATASAFSFVGLSPVLASSVEPDENPALLAMAARCSALEALCIAADADRLAARERYELLKPVQPLDIVFEHNERVPDWLRYSTEPERDGENEIIRRGGLPPRVIVSSYHIALQTPAVKSPALNDDPSGLVFRRQAYRKALRYEKGCEKARYVSGLNDTSGLMHSLYCDVAKYAKATCELEAKTWAGIAIKARACDLARKWAFNGSGLNTGQLASSYILPNILALSEGGAV